MKKIRELDSGIQATASASELVYVADSQTVAEFNASGLVFKDSVEVVALADPVVDGVTLYLSDFKRSLSAKMKSSDFFSEPTQSSLACVRSDGAVRVKSDLGGKEGAEMFAERKNLNLRKKQRKQKVGARAGLDRKKKSRDG